MGKDEPAVRGLADAPSVVRGSGVSAWRQIADALRDEIASGVLAAGERMPTEAELALRFGVNRHTLRRALAALAADGLVRADQGRGMPGNILRERDAWSAPPQLTWFLYPALPA